MNSASTQALIQGQAPVTRPEAGTLAAILRKELLAVLRDGRLLALAVVAFVTLAGFFAHAVGEQRQLQAERQAVGGTVQEQWNNQGVKHPHAAAHFGIYVFEPVSGLAAIDPGLRPYTGQALWLEPHKRNLPRFVPAADAGTAQRLGSASAAFLLYALLPLLVIALGFNAIAQEREQGTLRMLHCLGLSPRRLLGAKFIGLLLAFTAIFLPATVMAVAVLSASVGLGTDDAWRMAAMSLAYLLYFAIFAALAMAASAWFSRSRIALFALIGFWLLSVIAAPRIGASLADHLVRLPTATEFWAAIRADIENGLPGDGNKESRLAKFEAETLAKYGVQRVEDLPVGYGALRRVFNDAYSAKVHDLHFDRLRDLLRQQAAATHWAAPLGPTLAMRSLSMTLAGMDLAHRHEFDDAAESYRLYFIALTDDWDRDRSRGTDRGAKASTVDYRTVKSFEYQRPGIGFALRTGLLDALALLAWAGAAFALLLLSARRLKP